MKNTLKINHANHTIVMDRTFAKYAANTMSEEYAHLQQVRRDYPRYQVVQRHIRTNSDKNTYKGLTYEYMKEYIRTHGSKEEKVANLVEFEEMRTISQCQGMKYRYPVIKSWFMAKYPEIANFAKPNAPAASADSEGESNADVPAEKAQVEELEEAADAA